MRVFFFLALLSAFGCQHPGAEQPDEVADFESKVLNGVSAEADTGVESLRFICNNAPENAYRRGRITPAYSPNYVIKLFGNKERLTRAVFLEEAAIEKVLGEYTLDKHQTSQDLEVYTFASIVDNAKIKVSLKQGTGIAQTELTSGSTAETKALKIACAAKAR